jgi:hypothetical protein
MTQDSALRCHLRGSFKDTNDVPEKAVFLELEKIMRNVTNTGSVPLPLKMELSK